MRDWKTILNGFKPTRADDTASVRACQLALSAAEQHTFGVGAILLDAAGDVLVEGHNEVFIDQFRSDLHAEMVVLNKFEASPHPHEERANYTLVTSLEPCTMCMARLIFSGVGNIVYVREDDIGGMVRRMTALPPIFQKMTKDQGQTWRPADCAPELRDAAFEIWDQSRATLDQKIIRRT